MLIQPCSHKPELWHGQLSCNYLARFNVNDRYGVTVLRMEVGWWMLAHVHVDGDPVEFADAGHAPIVLREVIRVGRTG